MQLAAGCGVEADERIVHDENAGVRHESLRKLEFSQFSARQHYDMFVKQLINPERCIQHLTYTLKCLMHRRPFLLFSGDTFLVSLFALVDNNETVIYSLTVQALFCNAESLVKLACNSRGVLDIMLVPALLIVICAVRCSV